MATYNLLNTSFDSNNLVIGDIITCPYSGTYKKITLRPGKYKLECWGGYGGLGYFSTISSSPPIIDGNNGASGGPGGYSQGVLTLFENTILYLYTGGGGQSSTSTTKGTLIPGGFNGGGNSYVRYSTASYTSGGSGGGASDIRLGTDSLYARVIVAGGGGGSGGFTDSNTKSGGGLTGYSQVTDYQATQTTAGTGGSFGKGANAYSGGYNYNHSAGGGGGGWYGGGSAQNTTNITSYSYHDYNGGGSGYVYTSSTASDYPEGCLLNSLYYLTDAETISLLDSNHPGIPIFPGQTFETSDGFIRITVLTFDILNVGDQIVKNNPGVFNLSLPKGKYKLECWGAEGGSYSTHTGGTGGYSQGILTIEEETQAYIYVGGKGQTPTAKGLSMGGFNGGGNSYSSTVSRLQASGGGASDIRLGTDSLYARVIVAGGGGGSGYYSSTRNGNGGYGGGLQAENGTSCQTTYKPGTGGTQNTAGTSYYGTTANSTSTSYGSVASFGQGGGATTSSTGQVSGGGGGWYGGGYARYVGSGGGSGYVYTSSTASDYPEGCLLNSLYYLTDAKTFGGNENFSSINEDNIENGHSGDGAIKITVLSLNPFIEEQNESYSNIYIYNGRAKKYIQSPIFSSFPTGSKTYYFQFKALKNMKINFQFGIEYQGSTDYKDRIGRWTVIKKVPSYNDNTLLFQTFNLSDLVELKDIYLKKDEVILIKGYFYRVDNQQVNNINNICSNFSMDIKKLDYIPVIIPTQQVVLQYTGTTQFFSEILGNAPDYLKYYEVINNVVSGQNAGIYNTIVTLKDSTTCKWTDGTNGNQTVKWEILPESAYLNIEKLYYVYPNQKVTLKYSYSGDNNSKLQFSSNELSINHNLNNKEIEFISKNIGDIYTITGTNKLDSNYYESESYVTITVIEKCENLKIEKDKVIIIPYTNDKVELELPKGKYILQCFGASGGFRTEPQHAGWGAEVSGTLTLNHTLKLYCYVGGSGLAGGTFGGFNGGGARSIYDGGGGASDIRLGTDSLYARVIVAGGGGSEGGPNVGGGNGGLTGQDSNEGYGDGGYGGILDPQLINEYYTDKPYNSVIDKEGIKAGFGFGGCGIASKDGYGGAGGGGWYGGVGVYPDDSNDDDKGGGGGSSFILNEEYGQFCVKNYLLDSDYFLKDISIVDGTHEGDGYIQITVLDCPSKYYIKDNNRWKSIKSMFLKENETWKMISNIITK